MPTKPRQTIITVKDTKVVLNEYYASAKFHAVKYDVFRDRVRSLRDRGAKIDEMTLERAIKTPNGEYQTYSGSGRALQFKYQGIKFPELTRITFPSIKAFLIELGLHPQYSKIKDLRKKGVLCLDEAIG